MEISAVLLARALAFIETADLNPRGKAYFPYLVPLIVNKFNFQKYPTKPEDFDETAGINFVDGYNGEVTLDKLTIWPNGIGLDVRSSTQDAREILESSLGWLRDEAGLEYRPNMIRRWGFLSQITFHSSMDFNSLNPAISRACETISTDVEAIQGKRFDFQTSGIVINFDRTLAQSPIAAFTIQRRADSLFKESKFFSEAPLPTDKHIEVLKQFEAGLTK